MCHFRCCKIRCVIQLEKIPIFEKKLEYNKMKSSLITKIVTSKKTFLLTLISFLLSLQRQKKRMKRYKVIEVIKMLLDDGWEYCYTKGDH